MKLKLINLNTWWGGMHLWDNMVSYLKTEKPDVVMLQECFATNNPTHDPYLNTTQSLATILNMPYYEFAEECFLDNDTIRAPMGNAIISKLPLQRVAVEFIHGSSSRTVDDRDRSLVPEIPRNLLHCQIENHNQHKFNLIVTHGVWASGPKETPLQTSMAEKINKYLDNWDNIILSGDFNVNENTNAINSIERNLVNIYKGERVSSFNMQQKTDQGYGTAVVDFIFTSPNIKALEHRTSEENVSDHQSQIAIFEI